MIIFNIFKLFFIKTIGGYMDFENIKVRVDKPYPKIVGANTDPMTVGVLKNLAQGRVGELNAVLQYIFQSVVADKTKDEIGEIFEEIGIVEMTHLDMLMHAITDFGGVPRYEDSTGNQYNTGNINYSIKLKDMLNNNIQAEQKAIEHYNEAIKRVKNESLKDLFKRIIEDEQQHIRVFKYILDSVEFLSV